MPTKKKDIPQFFRLNVEAGNLDQAINFYTTLPGGGIVVRPWGERSFYVEDPWKNPLCFVEEGTVYTG